MFTSVFTATENSAAYQWWWRCGLWMPLPFFSEKYNSISAGIQYSESSNKEISINFWIALSRTRPRLHESTTTVFQNQSSLIFHRVQHWWSRVKTSSQFSQFTTFPLLWNLWILSVNLSAQSSQSTSIVGKSFSKSFSHSSTVSQSLSSRLSKAGSSTYSWSLAGVRARGAGGGKLFTQEGETGEGGFSGEGRLLSSSLSGDSISLSPILKSDLNLWAKGEVLEGEVVESRARFFAVCRRWTQAEAAWRSDPVFGGGRLVEAAAKAARWSTERW